MLGSDAFEGYDCLAGLISNIKLNFLAFRHYADIFCRCNILKNKCVVSSCGKCCTVTLSRFNLEINIADCLAYLELCDSEVAVLIFVAFAVVFVKIEGVCAPVNAKGHILGVLPVIGLIVV